MLRVPARPAVGGGEKVQGLQGLPSGPHQADQRPADTGPSRQAKGTSRGELRHCFALQHLYTYIYIYIQLRRGWSRATGL